MGLPALVFGQAFLDLFSQDIVLGSRSQSECLAGGLLGVVKAADFGICRSQSIEVASLPVAGRGTKLASQLQGHGPVSKAGFRMSGLIPGRPIGDLGPVRIQTHRLLAPYCGMRALQSLARSLLHFRAPLSSVQINLPWLPSAKMSLPSTVGVALGPALQ